MKPIDGRQYPQDTRAASTIDLRTIMSNVINCAVRGEQHERLLSRYTSSDIFAGYKETLGEVDKWDVSNALTPEREESAKVLQTMQLRLGVIGSKLLDVKQHVPNFGEYLVKFMNDIKAREEVGLASTGLPYGMSWIRCPTEPIKFTNATTIPGPSHPASIQFGKLMAEWDRAAFSPTLLSHAESAAGFDVKDRVTGTQMVTVERARMYHAQLVAYVMLYPTMYLHFMWPFWTECYKLLARTSSYWEERLRIHELWDKRRAGLPQNQLTSLVASLNGHVTMKSFFGDKPILFDATETLDGYHKMMDIGIELDKLMRQPTTTSWGIWEAGGMISPYQLIMQYESLDRLLEEINRVTGAIGWHTKSSGEHMINAIGADFIWSDGDHYSENPYTALFGLKPIVAPNNATAQIDDRRQEKDWNNAPLWVGDAKPAGEGADSNKYNLRYSVMFVEGRQSITGDGSELERYFIPSNAYLGEPDAVRIRFSSSLEDPMTAMAYEYYKSKGTLYINEMYIEPTLTTDSQVYITSWDSWAKGSDARSAQNKLIAALPPNVIAPVADAIMYRAKWFNHRFIVAISRPQTIRHYSGLGEFRKLEKQDGHVLMSGGELTLSHSPETLKELVLYGMNPASDKLLAEATAVPIAT